MDFSFIYSETIFLFLKKVKQEAKKILKDEMHISLKAQRFQINSLSYPLHFVVFEHPSKLGYFDHEMFEIGINKCYLFEKTEALHDLLRHELAHYITFIEHGSFVSHHGKEFHSICSRYGWKTEVSRATTSSVLSKNPPSRLFQKVQKLFALAESHHEHEAKLATAKAHELLMKHNLETLSEFKDDDEFYIQRLFKLKRSSSKLQAIASVLKHFFVYPVFNHGQECVYLEIFGNPINLEIASYIASVLEREMENLWKITTQLKGKRAKNAFFQGIAEGYIEKIKPNQKGFALVPLTNQLAHVAEKAYPHLRSTFSKRQIDQKARNQGKEKGKNLSIRLGIREKTQNIVRYLTHSFTEKT